MIEIDWTKLAPVFGILAFAAGLFGIYIPEARNFAIASLLFFGLVMLYGWFVTVRESKEKDRKITSQSTQIEKLNQDVTRHRNALDDLADGLDQAVFLIDKDSQILYANERATMAFGFENPIGKTILAVTLSNELTELVKSASKNNEHRKAEINLHNPRQRNMLATVWPESSAQSRIFVSLVDITSLRRLERVRRDFVANVSHELRTPMTTIRAMAETVEDELPTNHENRPYLTKIIKEVDRLTRITDDLLTLSAAESAAPPKSNCDLVEIVSNIVSNLRQKAEEKGLSLELSTPENLPIFANDGQLNQVAMNLIDNAINYTSRGFVRVNLTTQDSNAILTVQDSGIGVSSDHLPRLFERFYRVDKGRSRATGGTGLGLSIVRHIVEAHGGSVEVESELNKGSTFTVSIPTSR